MAYPFDSFSFTSVMTNIVLPIKQKDIYGGMAEITGLIRKDSNVLVVEYQVKDDVLGMFHSDVKVLNLPFNHIQSIEVVKKWFVCDFEIYLNRLPTIQKPLAIRENCLSFRINKKDVEKARSIRTSLMIAITEKRLNDMDEEEEDPADEFHESKPVSAKQSNKQSDREGGLNNMLRDI